MDTRIPFEDFCAKTQWALKKILGLVTAISLFYTPNAVLDVLNVLPPFSFKSYSFVINTKNLLYLMTKSNIEIYILIGRIFAIFLLFTLLISWVLTKKRIHKRHSNMFYLKCISFTVLFFILANIEYSWHLIEPIRTSINTWFSSPL